MKKVRRRGGTRRRLKQTHRNVEGVATVLNWIEQVQPVPCPPSARIAHGNHVVQDESREVHRYLLRRVDERECPTSCSIEETERLKERILKETCPKGENITTSMDSS